jgi:hypothetical protein
MGAADIVLVKDAQEAMGAMQVLPKPSEEKEGMYWEKQS